jgi:hypothetical protein
LFGRFSLVDFFCQQSHNDGEEIKHKHTKHVQQRANVATIPPAC